MKKEELTSFAIDILSEFSPYIGAVRDTFEKTCSISDRIIMTKLIRLFTGQIDDMESKIKLTSDFQKGSKKYKENMKRLLYVINTISLDEKIDIISNLMRSLSMNLIDLKMFWRLVDIVEKMYYDDIKEFAEFVSDNNLNNFSNITILQINNLVECTNASTMQISRGGEKSFIIPTTIGGKEFKKTRIGLELIRCGYDLDNYSLYK
ncbi:hypothetical protein [Ruminococcus flavefaciens]|uniref:Uncharacterized protein n=1 Tax=Ruminococcus flavefaciens TaxID=1265 RepID=A0A315XW35_RUMFL|nr:hypothetical protein [Ruminococcus flavefaciens]PWJ09637.1 hypothetical protein IE37_03456 [Ruminococcus flavefaciens]SSA52302.1 hypothetical protein SAMN02910325_03456 [Ruminococcus flavefaciens]